MSRRFILLLAIFTFLIPIPFSSSAANALQTGRAERIHTMSSATWAVVAHGRTQPVTPNPYILVWTVTSGTAYDYFFLRNTGTIMVQSFRVAIAQVRLTGNGNSQEIFFERCIGGSWNPATNLCSGTASLIGRASDGQLLLSSLNLVPGSFVDFRARTLPNNQSTFETTLSTQVKRSDLRSAETSNS